MMAIVAIVAILATRAALAAKIILRDGRSLEGKIARLPDMLSDPSQTNLEVKPIVLLDDDLRRVFIPKRQIDAVNESAGEPLVTFNVPQQIIGGGAPIASVGQMLKFGPFDDWGRRTVTMNATTGPVDIIQGITVLTPYYAKVMALRTYQLDMRIATSSIPRETIARILARIINPHDLNHRSNVVRFYLQAERFEDARAELDQLLKDFPAEKATLDRTLRDITQLSMRRLLTEVRVRAKAGQHRLAYGMLKNFPSQGVAGEILQEVQQRLDDYDDQRRQGTEVLALLDAHIKAVVDTELAKQLEPIYKEIAAELNVHTLDRMAAYQQFAHDDQFTLEQKIALALSGWVLGSKGAIDNLAVTLSLYEVRAMIREYFASPLKVERDLLLQKMISQEGAQPELVAKILAHMKPPLATPEEPGGLYTLTASGLPGDAPVTYHVQLPPEYDPYFRYPAVVTLHGGGSQPHQQIDWWAGGFDEKGARRGQATRYGYIVIAPAWGKEHQSKYDYSLREHVAVLSSLRDACRRFSIDTDRVFLSGHSMGGDASWDIGLAHPDLWAGVIPVVATCDRFCDLYWKNGRNLPLYCIGGELDGDKAVKNAVSLDRYMTSGFPVTVVEYQGRGHEHFSDEIQNLFEWMGRVQRDFFPKEFQAVTMREFDNYFWWIELHNMPARAMVNPALWPPKRNVLPLQVEAKVLSNNTIHITTGASRASLWLSPEMISFDEPIRVSFNGARVRDPGIAPDLKTLLEDVRTRGDRQHPFWAKINIPN
jgi:predicted esterase